MILSAFTQNTPAADPKQALLAQMHDIQPPPPASAWPPGPGWWLLLAIVLAAVGIGLWAFWKHRQGQQYRRLALRQLDSLCAPEQSDAERNVQQHCAAISTLLKRAFLTAYPGARSFAGALAGADFSRLLAATLPEGKRLHADSHWFSAAYNPNANLDTRELEAFARFWIKHHQPMGSGQLRRRLAPRPPAEAPVHV